MFAKERHRLVDSKKKKKIRKQGTKFVANREMNATSTRYAIRYVLPCETELFVAEKIAETSCAGNWLRTITSDRIKPYKIIRRFFSETRRYDITG